MRRPIGVVVPTRAGEHRAEHGITPHPAVEQVQQPPDVRLGDRTGAASGKRCGYHSTTAASTMTRFQTSMLTSDRIMVAVVILAHAERVAHQVAGQQEHPEHRLADHRPPSGAEAP